MIEFILQAPVQFDGMDSIQRLMDGWGITIDAFIVVATVILIQVVKKMRIFPWNKRLLPVLIPAIAVFFFSTHIDAMLSGEEETTYFHIFYVFMGEWLMCIMGTFLLYHIIWNPIQKKFGLKKEE